MKTLETRNTNILRYAAPLTFFASALLPEYVAPVLAVVCFFLVLKAKIAQKKKPHIGSIGTSILIFIGWMVVCTSYSSYFISSLISIGLWILMLTGFYLTSETLDSEAKIQKIFSVGSLSSGIAGAIGIIQMLLFHFGDYISTGLSKLFNPFWHFLDVLFSKIVLILPDVISSMLPRTKFNVFPTRACSTFSNPLFFAAFEVIMIPFSAYCFLCMKDKKHRLLGLLCFFLSLGGVASSYSRGPYLAAAAVVVLLLLYGGKKALIIALAGVGSAGILMIFASGTIKRMFTLISKKTDISISTRAQVWSAAVDMVKKHPIFGYGTGFNNIRQLLHNTYHVKQPHAHNIFLEIWLENGIFGVLLFAAILILFAINLIKLARLGKEQRYYAVTLFASVSGFVLCGMTDCLFYGLKPLQYLMLIFGISQAVFNVYLGNNEIYLLPKSVIAKIASAVKNKSLRKGDF